MLFFEVYLLALLTIMIMITILWLVSVIVKNVSIIDVFWGVGFVLASLVYFIVCDGEQTRKILVMILVAAWGIRLSTYLVWRNIGKGEDFRYREFRRKYGEKRYWWISYFQTFLLQGVLMWLISAPLLGAQFFGEENPLGILDYIGIGIWIIGFVFEAGGDLQLAFFRSKPENKGRVLRSGFWKYTRHPNYFGDSVVWWGFAFFCFSAGSYLPALGSILMTLVIIKVSGVALLEKTLKETKPEYRDYMERTSAFFPWFPKK